MELEFVLIFFGMIGFYNAAQFEARDGGNNHGYLWAGLSALVSGVAYAAFGPEWQGWLIAQVVLFLGIGVVRALLEERANRAP